MLRVLAAHHRHGRRLSVTSAPPVDHRCLLHGLGWPCHPQRSFTFSISGWLEQRKILMEWISNGNVVIDRRSFHTSVPRSGRRLSVGESSSFFSTTRLVLPEAGHPFEIVNPCTDFGFKKAFSNRTVLIDFLNHILNYKDANQIVDLSYSNEGFPSLDQSGRDFRVDIVCKTKNDRYFLIEMQNDYTADYPNKAYVEFARFLSRIDVEKIRDASAEGNKKRQLGQTEVDAQEFWRKIEEVSTVVISNKRFKPDAMKEKFTDETIAEPDIINTYEMRNITHPTRHLGNLEAKVVLVMLANFSKTAEELETDTDRWLFALKDDRMATGKLKMSPFKEVTDIAKTASESEALKQFYAELHTSNIGRDLLSKYANEVQETNDRFARTFAEGEASGEARGEHNAAIRIAKALKSQGIEISAITTATGLTAEIIAAL